VNPGGWLEASWNAELNGPGSGSVTWPAPHTVTPNEAIDVFGFTFLAEKVTETVVGEAGTRTVTASGRGLMARLDDAVPMRLDAAGKPVPLSYNWATLPSWSGAVAAGTAVMDPEAIFGAESDWPGTSGYLSWHDFDPNASPPSPATIEYGDPDLTDPYYFRGTVTLPYHPNGSGDVVWHFSLSVQGDWVALVNGEVVGSGTGHTYGGDYSVLTGTQPGGATITLAIKARAFYLCNWVSYIYHDVVSGRTASIWAPMVGLGLVGSGDPGGWTLAAIYAAALAECAEAPGDAGVSPSGGAQMVNKSWPVGTSMLTIALDLAELGLDLNVGAGATGSGLSVLLAQTREVSHTGKGIAYYVAADGTLHKVTGGDGTARAVYVQAGQGSELDTATDAGVYAASALGALLVPTVVRSTYVGDAPTVGNGVLSQSGRMDENGNPVFEVEAEEGG
jgi:hypothetical protein